MRYHQNVLIALLAFGLTVAGCAPEDAATEDVQTGAWQDLFDGTTLSGWNNPYDWGEAWVENGEIRLRADRKFWLFRICRGDPKMLWCAHVGAKRA
jgi:hypothetical protein